MVFIIFMKKSLKKIVVFLILLTSFLALGQAVQAADGYGLGETGGAIGYETGGTGNTIPSLVNKIISVALIALALVFFGLTVYAGLRWMTARGNDEMVTKAKETLEGAVIGLVIVSVSYALTKFIFSQIAP